ncbi:MAG: hypothetical protein HYR96_13175 [Deltaproteobacteria bacterium]|nr:hypothetical protein [Deltaproteobacteria bacterium]MBI3295674.1 hypothetical protein [Deltaproteobacteria bacterium]
MKLVHYWIVILSLNPVAKAINSPNQPIQNRGHFARLSELNHCLISLKPNSTLYICSQNKADADLLKKSILIWAKILKRDDAIKIEESCDNAKLVNSPNIVMTTDGKHHLCKGGRVSTVVKIRDSYQAPIGGSFLNCENSPELRAKGFLHAAGHLWGLCAQLGDLHAELSCAPVGKFPSARSVMNQVTTASPGEPTDDDVLFLKALSLRTDISSQAAWSELQTPTAPQKHQVQPPPAKPSQTHK